MSSQFQGRPILAGSCRGEALVSHHGFNTLASFQKSIVLRQKVAVCGDQNNPDLYQKVMTGKILCLPQTIGSTTGGLVLQTAAEMGQMPQAMLFSEHIDSLAAAGVILTDVWLSQRIVVVDLLGPDFLQAVQTGQQVEVRGDGLVIIE
jgi:uncharacterized protein